MARQQVEHSLSIPNHPARLPAPFIARNHTIERTDLKVLLYVNSEKVPLPQNLHHSSIVKYGDSHLIPLEQRRTRQNADGRRVPRRYRRKLGA
jgi:hypothetical protein